MTHGYENVYFNEDEGEGDFLVLYDGGKGREFYANRLDAYRRVEQLLTAEHETAVYVYRAVSEHWVDDED